VTFAVYSKRDGTLQLGPAPIHSLWNGFGGLCENGGETATYSDGGDPVVLYDHLADRWLVSQLQFDETFTRTAQCVAISTSSDATGSYNRYEFDFGVNFPDYPKFGIWPDAYYNSINVFPGKSFAGAEACAFDRAAMRHSYLVARRRIRTRGDCRSAISRSAWSEGMRPRLASCVSGNDVSWRAFCNTFGPAANADVADSVTSEQMTREMRVNSGMRGASVPKGSMRRTLHLLNVREFALRALHPP